MYSEVFPSRLKEARKKSGYTQVEAAKKLKTTQASISKYEIGLAEPDIEQFAKMAVLYEVSADWLCGISSQGGPDLKKEIREERERQKILKKMEKEAELANRLMAN